MYTVNINRIAAFVVVSEVRQVNSKQIFTGGQMPLVDFLHTRCQVANTETRFAQDFVTQPARLIRLSRETRELLQNSALQN